MDQDQQQQVFTTLAVLREQRRKVSESPYVDLAQTRAGVQALEAAGLLAAGRALQILDAPIQQHERYTFP